MVCVCVFSKHDLSVLNRQQTCLTPYVLGAAQTNAKLDSPMCLGIDNTKLSFCQNLQDIKAHAFSRLAQSL